MSQQNAAAAGHKEVHPLGIDSIEKVFHVMQQKIIAALEVLLPQGYDFSELEQMFSQPVTSHMDYGILIVNLLEYFIRTVSANIVRMEDDYSVLEAQTQKLEAQVRNHVKFEQTARLFMTIKLESLDKYKRQSGHLKIQIQHLTARLRDAELRNPPRHPVRYYPEPKPLAEYEKVASVDQYPQKRVVDNRLLKRKRPDYESPRVGRIEQTLQFNPEASSHRYHSLQS